MGFWRLLGESLSRFTKLVSGEFMLDVGYRYGYANGGTMIFLRSVWVTLWLFLLALLLHSGTYADWTWNVCLWRLDATKFKKEIANNVPWLGAIFAGAYVALYTRFSAQYSYLQQAYNQLMETSASAPRDECASEVIHSWWAAFIEDAQDLHLATKGSFAVAIWFMLEEPEVYRDFEKYAIGRHERVNELILPLRRVIGDEELKRMQASKELMAGGPPPPRKSAQVVKGDTSAVDRGHVALAALAAGCIIGAGISAPYSLTRKPRRSDR